MASQILHEWVCEFNLLVSENYEYNLLQTSTVRLLACRWFKYISEAADSQKKSNTIRRTPVSKLNLTLAEVGTEDGTEKFSSGEPAPDSNLTTNK